MHNDINLVILQYMLVYSDDTGEVLLAMRTFVLHRNAVMLLLHVSAEIGRLSEPEIRIQYDVIRMLLLSTSQRTT